MTVAFSAARNHDTPGVTTGQRKVDERGRQHADTGQLDDSDPFLFGYICTAGLANEHENLWGFGTRHKLVAQARDGPMRQIDAWLQGA